MLLNKESIDLILEHEIGGGEKYYNAKLIHPTYPGGESGVTWGCGWDARFNSQEDFLKDWAKLNEETQSLLFRVVGARGKEALLKYPEVKKAVIPFDLAIEVFQNRTVIKFWNLCLKTFPCFLDLHPNCQGALVSLVFNRGSSLNGETRREMKRITKLTCAKDYKQIAKEIRNMKRLWVGKGLDGLLRRREDEAKLVESCI